MLNVGTISDGQPGTEANIGRLSICIPTFDRYPFLQWTLAKTRADFPDAEIVVSDNCSTDATQYMWSDDEKLKIIHQKTNIGPFANFRAALLEGTGKYCTYLGDDDYLLARKVHEGCEYMEANRSIVAYFAPCQLYNEVEQKEDWNAFYVASDETFKNPGSLWNFVIGNHVWPEHAIWRREGLEDILKPRQRAYWAFLDLANAFAKGPVHFASEPFYRNITQHPVGFRQKLGDHQCLTDFDEYRAGLEILAFELFKDHLNPELKQQINKGIQHFINQRIGVAHRLFPAYGLHEEAEACAKRLAICG